MITLINVSGPVSMDALNKMVANSMKDVADSDDDDINDPELLVSTVLIILRLDYGGLGPFCSIHANM